MGYRAHVITVEREYGQQTFSSWEQFTNDFVPALGEAGFDITGDENETFFEIEKEHLQKFVDSLPENDEDSIYPDYSNKTLKVYLQAAIDETKSSWVSWEWF